MTVSTASYSQPKLQTILLDSFDEAPDFKPEFTRLDTGHGKSHKYWCAYRVCYLDRRSIDPTIQSNNERANVNLSSLCTQRVTLMHIIVKGLLEGHSGVPPFPRLEAAFDWIDQQNRANELQNLEGTQRLYRDYTNHLRHRMLLSNVGTEKKSISQATASGRQVAMAYICGLASECELQLIQSWAIRIPQKKMGPNELPSPATTGDEHALANELHRRYFDAFSKAVINNSQPPVLVKLADLGFEDLIFYSMHANNAGGWSAAKKSKPKTNWQPFFYQPEGVFKGTVKAFNELLSENGLPPLINSSFSRMQRNNSQFTPHTLISIANFATRHFGYLLLAEAGNNAAHLASINCKHARLDKALGIASTRAIKGRAGSEVQDQYVDVHFAQTIWRQYVKLRTWMASKVETPPKLGLFLLNAGDDKEDSYPLTYKSMKDISYWPSCAPSLVTRPARKHKTVNLLEGSGGNMALVANMQFARPQTIERHYNFKNREEAVKVMNEYFAAQAKSAQLRDRGVTPTRVISSGAQTTTGICDEVADGPRLIEGYEELGIEPRCSAPITCIFCVHFGLHGTHEDFVRLLTVNHWIEIQSRLYSINIDDHFQKFVPYANRIQYILDDLSTENVEFSERINKAKISFDKGERDSYWNAKINALLEIMEN